MAIHQKKHNFPIVKLGEVAEEIHERISSAKVKLDEYITTDNMVKNRGGVVVAEYVPENVGLVRYQKGDVLIANIRPYLRKIWLADKDGGCSSDVVVFRPAVKELRSEYLHAALSQDTFFDYVMRKPRGTKMPRGDRAWMKDFEISLPPLDEQREVVEGLERRMGKVEEMEKRFEGMRVAAERAFKAQLNEAFNQLDAPMFSGRLEDACELIADCPHSTAKDEGKGYPLVRTPNVGCGRLIYEKMHRVSKAVYQERNRRARPMPGDLIYAREAPAGNAALIVEGEEVCLGQRTVLIRPNRKIADAAYLTYYLLSENQRNRLLGMAAGATVQHVNLASIRGLEIVLPSLGEQRRVVEELDCAKGKYEKLIGLSERGRASAQALRKALLKEAFE